jgi:hypothetical protein
MEIKYRVAALYENRDCAHFTEEGMTGVQRKNPDRPVSLISLAARQAVDQAVKRGLCYKRFTADITITCDQMPPTGTLLESNELVLGILPERKTCWPECILLQEKLPCPLIDGVRYARVQTSGKLCEGDLFKAISLNESNTKDQSP